MKPLSNHTLGNETFLTLNIYNRSHACFHIASGIQHATIFGTQPYGLPLGVATTPQYLKALGYRTHGVGKVGFQ